MGERLGLIIGNSVYRDETLSRLVTPDVDVGDLVDILLDPEIGGFDDVKQLVNASFANIRQAIADFFARKKREDLLLLYFSGHGVLDDRGLLYLAVKDTRRDLLRATAIPAAFITEEMNQSRSQRQLLVLDCCHSGAFARGTKGTPGATVGTATAFEGTGYGRWVLTASDATEYAWEGDHISGQAENSVFTHHFIQGLKSGEADVDQDGQITVDEIYDYIYERIVKQTARQTPGKWSYKERGELILAKAARPDAVQEVIEPSIDTQQELKKEIEKRLSRLYLRGLSAFHLEDWEKAVRNLQAVIDVQPDYQEAAERLSEAKRQAHLAQLFAQADAAQAEEDWPAALAALEAIASDSPGYRDSEARLVHVRLQHELTALYKEARQLHQEGHWEAVLRVFEKITALAPDYPDPEHLQDSAHQSSAVRQRQEQLHGLYDRALQAMDAAQLAEAQRYLEDVLEIEPDFEDTQKLLVRVKANLEDAEILARESETSEEPISEEQVDPLVPPMETDTLAQVEDSPEDPAQQSAPLTEVSPTKAPEGQLEQDVDEAELVQVPPIKQPRLLEIMQGVVNWFQPWIIVLRPSTGNLTKIANHPHASFLVGYLWIVIASGIGLALSITFNLVRGHDFIFLEMFAGLFSTIFSPVVYILGIGLIHLAARLFGGSGRYVQLFYTFASFSAPFALLYGASSLRSDIMYGFSEDPIGLSLFAIVLPVYLYHFILTLMSVRVVHGFGITKSIAVVLFPMAVFLIALVVFSSIILILILYLNQLFRM